MRVEMLKTKIHRATITEADLNYVGSITIDEDLLDAAGMMEYERVYILNINNGNRFDTYTIKGERGSGRICINGAAARLVQPGDMIIILAYCSLEQDEAKYHTPCVVHVNERNEITEIVNREIAEPMMVR